MIVLEPASEIARILGQRLRTRRLLQNVTQEDLAQRAGLSVGTIRRLEDEGRCSLFTLLTVVKTLGITQELEDLFEPPRTSIRELERAAEARSRQRASGTRTKP